MNASTIGFNALTVQFNAPRCRSIRDELPFSMPRIGAEPAVILGATKATAFAVQKTVKAGRRPI